MTRIATIAFATAFFASSGALACGGWKSAESGQPITTAQAETSSGQSPAPWTQGSPRN